MSIYSKHLALCERASELIGWVCWWTAGGAGEHRKQRDAGKFAAGADRLVVDGGACPTNQDRNTLHILLETPEKTVSYGMITARVGLFEWLKARRIDHTPHWFK